jgi:hypothetical protein
MINENLKNLCDIVAPVLDEVFTHISQHVFVTSTIDWVKDEYVGAIYRQD